MPLKRRGNWSSGHWQLGCRCWRRSDAQNNMLGKRVGFVHFMYLPPHKKLYYAGECLLWEVCSGYGGPVWSGWVCGGEDGGEHGGGRIEANVRGDAGSDNTCKFRPPSPTCVCPPSILPQLPRRIRTGTSGAQNSMRAPAGGWGRGASLTAPIHQRHESKTHHKDGRARPRASGSGQSVCNERPCEAR